MGHTPAAVHFARWKTEGDFGDLLQKINKNTTEKVFQQVNEIRGAYVLFHCLGNQGDEERALDEWWRQEGGEGRSRSQPEGGQKVVSSLALVDGINRWFQQLGDNTIFVREGIGGDVGSFANSCSGAVNEFLTSCSLDPVEPTDAIQL